MERQSEQRPRPPVGADSFRGPAPGGDADRAEGLSVGAAFLSTVIPGAILTVVYVGLNFLFLRNVDTITVEEKIPLGAAVRRIGHSSKDAFWALLMPVIILGTIYSGIATPTEAAAIALVYAVVVGFLFYRGLTFRNFPSTIVHAAITTGSIVAVLFFLFVMSRAMIPQQVPKEVAEALVALTESRILVTPTTSWPWTESSR